MPYTFQIDSAARFNRDGDKVALLRERLFGKPLPKAGARPNTPLVTDQKPGTSGSTRLSKSAQTGDQKPAASALRRRPVLEYKGYQISGAQQPDGNWIAGFVRREAGAKRTSSTASYATSSMAFADAKRQIDDAAALADSASARREFLRVPVSLKGRLFAGDDAQDCQILDLSAGGARLQCADPAALTGDLTLYIEGFGRYRASMVPGRSTDLCLRFIADDELVLSLLKGLSGYVKGYSPAQTKLRRETRVVAPISTVCQDQDGTAIPCEIINASMRGMSIAMTARPQIGTLVTLGRTQLRVVRHHDLGVAVQQISAASGKAASRYTFGN